MQKVLSRYLMINQRKDATSLFQWQIFLQKPGFKDVKFFEHKALVSGALVKINSPFLKQSTNYSSNSIIFSMGFFLASNDIQGGMSLSIIPSNTVFFQLLLLCIIFFEYRDFNFVSTTLPIVYMCLTNRIISLYNSDAFFHRFFCILPKNRNSNQNILP